MAISERLERPTALTERHREVLKQRRGLREVRLTLLIVLVHVPLGVILYSSGFVSIIHPIMVFLIGMYWAIRKRYGLDRVAIAVGYLIGAEVLWRMARVPVFYEFGKYGTSAILIVALLVRIPRIKVPVLPLLYFVALVPACFVTLAVFSPSEARASLSFNMSGPLLLAVSCWFFYHSNFTVTQLRRFTFAVIIPIVSVATSTLFFTVTLDDIQFNTESNFSTSGGFGPNQVSSILGLGVLFALGSLVLFKNSAKMKFLLGAAALLFAAQGVMTFSRGGIYNAVGALLVLILFQVRNFSEAAKRVIPLAALTVIFIWFVFPLLNDFTGGKLQERFEDTGTTNRFEIMQSDTQMFVENPILGVGVGVSRNYRKQFLGFGAASHTEFSRLIAEHGSLGVLALICLSAAVFVNIKNQRSVLGRSLIAGVAVWSVLYMLNTGMRLAAPSVLLGLTFIAIGGRTILSKSRRMRSGRKLSRSYTKKEDSEIPVPAI